MSHDFGSTFWRKKVEENIKTSSKNQRVGNHCYKTLRSLNFNLSIEYV